MARLELSAWAFNLNIGDLPILFVTTTATINDLPIEWIVDNKVPAVPVSADNFRRVGSFIEYSIS
jgi:hypothetical protein